MYFRPGGEATPQALPRISPGSSWKMGVWGFTQFPSMGTNESKTGYLKAPSPRKEGLGQHTLCVWFRNPLPSPLPVASSIAGGAAASAAGAPCRWSLGWPGSCCLQRGSRSSGIFPARPHSPAWGAVKGPPSGPSPLVCRVLAKMATET